MFTAMITRMMPPAIDRDPVEKCSSLARSSPRRIRRTATTLAVTSIFRRPGPFVALSIPTVVSTKGTSAIFGPSPISSSKNESITRAKSIVR
jgi:hypothetical protein